MKWNEHVNYLKFKLTSSLFVLRRISQTCTQSAAFSVYHSLIMSPISYGIILWGASSVGNLDSIFKIQKKALRLVLNLNSTEPCKAHFQHLNYLTVPSLYIFQTILFVRNHQNEFPTLGQHHEYNTRNKTSFSLYKHRLQITETQWSYIGVKLFNKLPAEIKETTNNQKFKKTLKSFLCNKAFYSLAEYLDI